MPRPLAVASILVALASSAVGDGYKAKPAIDSHVSYFDVAARRAELRQTQSPRVRAALAGLQTCTALPPAGPPQGPMRIPPHYLHGNHGPTNPEEHATTQIYEKFERRVNAGMNQFLVTASHPEAQCAQDEIDRWAQANELVDYDAVENSQSWYQTEWTLSSIALSESVLVNDAQLDPHEMARDIAWMNKAAHRMVGFPSESKHTNNHHYWRGLAASATGVISSDTGLFNFGVQAYKDAVDDIDQRGALPKEMARSERSIHYQSFALQPLLPIAEFAERQHVPLYNYTSPTGHTIADAISFLGEAVADPAIVRAYTPEDQLMDSDSPDFFAAIEFYRRRFPERKLPPSIAAGLSKPTSSARLGGSTTVIAGQ